MSAVVTAVPASTSLVTLSAGNPNKTEVSVYYDGAAILYLIAGPDASITKYTAKLGDGFLTYWELPDPDYTGPITGVWSAATGSALVTEYV